MKPDQEESSLFVRESQSTLMSRMRHEGCSLHSHSP